MEHRYLYILEDMSLVKCSQDPTQSDLNAIADGLLQIIKLDASGEFVEVNEDGTDLEISPISRLES